MKKILIAICAAVAVMMTACSSAPSAGDVAEKIKNHETLTEADYTAMADYVIDGYRELGTIATDAKSGDANTETVVNKLIELNNKLEYQQQFVEALNRYAADPNATKYQALDSKLEEIAKLRDEASVDIRSTAAPIPRPADGSEPSATQMESEGPK